MFESFAPKSSGKSAAQVDGARAPAVETSDRAAVLPAVSPRLVGWFKWYARRYLVRHFHAVRLSRCRPAPVHESVPLVIYLNHASWWDPLVCAILADTFFPQRTSFVPMASAALDKYRFFSRLGFFPVQAGRREGAAQFLRAAQEVLREPNHLLWITPQGRFADVRERPLEFLAGLGHLPKWVERASFVPLAIEYVFWEEKRPEILVRFGESLRVSRRAFDGYTPQAWTAVFESKLQATQDALAAEALRRQPSGFECVVRGRVGISAFYDAWRRAEAWARGRAFTPSHGDK